MKENSYKKSKDSKKSSVNQRRSFTAIKGSRLAEKKP